MIRALIITMLTGRITAEVQKRNNRKTFFLLVCFFFYIFWGVSSDFIPEFNFFLSKFISLFPSSLSVFFCYLNIYIIL